ncbi:hypothetical protein CRUP_011642, partial [Coryphaenoides rupestris]
RPPCRATAREGVTVNPGRSWTGSASPPAPCTVPPESTIRTTFPPPTTTMKPDGVATAPLEPMEALESHMVNEAAPPTGEEPSQAAGLSESTGPQPTGEPVEGEVRPEAPAAKTPSDPKAKSAGKAGAMPKPGTAGGAKAAQSRLTNGTSKPNGVAKTNGVAKKTASSAADKKSTAPAKKPVGTAGALPTKMGAKPLEKKPMASSRPSAAAGIKPAAATKTAAATKPAAATKKTPAAATKTGPAAATKTGPAAALAKKPAGET